MVELGVWSGFRLKVELGIELGVELGFELGVELQFDVGGPPYTHIDTHTHTHTLTHSHTHRHTDTDHITRGPSELSVPRKRQNHCGLAGRNRSVLNCQVDAVPAV